MAPLPVLKQRETCMCYPPPPIILTTTTLHWERVGDREHHWKPAPPINGSVAMLNSRYIWGQYCLKVRRRDCWRMGQLFSFWAHSWIYGSERRTEQMRKRLGSTAMVWDFWANLKNIEVLRSIFQKRWSGNISVHTHTMSALGLQTWLHGN